MVKLEIPLEHGLWLRRVPAGRDAMSRSGGGGPHTKLNALQVQQQHGDEGMVVAGSKTAQLCNRPL